MIEDLDKLQKLCPCVAIDGHCCGVCKEGYHIFCNFVPHGSPEEAHDWFIKNPKATQEIEPVTPCPEYERAIKEINKKDNANK